MSPAPDVHGGHERYLMVAVLAVVGIVPGVVRVVDHVLVLVSLVAVVVLLPGVPGVDLDTLRLASMLLQEPLHGEEPVSDQLYPLVRVAHAGVLDQGPEHHEEADEEVDVDALHIGDLGQGGVDAVAEGGHGKHGGHAETHPGGGGSSVEPE